MACLQNHTVVLRKIKSEVPQNGVIPHLHASESRAIHPFTRQDELRAAFWITGADNIWIAVSNYWPNLGVDHSRNKWKIEVTAASVYIAAGSISTLTDPWYLSGLSYFPLCKVWTSAVFASLHTCPNVFPTLFYLENLFLILRSRDCVSALQALQEVQHSLIIKNDLEISLDREFRSGPGCRRGHSHGPRVCVLGSDGNQEEFQVCVKYVVTVEQWKWWQGCEAGRMAFWFHWASGAQVSTDKEKLLNWYSIWDVCILIWAKGALGANDIRLQRRSGL